MQPLYPSTQKDIHTLAIVQRRGARYVCNKHAWEQIKCRQHAYYTLEWKPLEQNREQARLRMLYKIYNKEVELALKTD